jgi:hypothetical protein
LLTITGVKQFALAILLAVCSGTNADADPTWRLDLSARGIASVELDNSATMTRDGVVPAMSARVERRIGNLYVGGTFGGGMPAWYGKAEALGSIDCEHVLSDGDARWAFDAGMDAGVGLLYFDAPPETSPTDNALLYWGPLARARLQLHVMQVMPNARAVGLVVGASTAVTSARYMSPGSGTGLRLEPELELGLTMRL